MTDAVLVENLQKQLDRLMNQLSDIEEEKPNMDTQEYEELKSETMEELKDLSRSLEKMTGGDITSTDSLTATRMAVRAAISQTLRTPAILGLFARKQPIALRQRLILLDHDLRMRKVSENKYDAQKVEILTALVNLKEELSEDERTFLHQKQLKSIPRTDLMDCSEWDQAAGSVTPAPVTLCSPQTSTLDESEEMDVDFTENFRHIRNTSYDQDVIGSDLRSEQWFPKDETTRKCIVFDTCALIADPNIVHDCIGSTKKYSLQDYHSIFLFKELRFDDEQNLLERVFVVIPYRVLYELDRLKRTLSTSLSATQLPQKASRVIKMLCDLRGSSMIYWESSTESYEEVDGFVASSSEDINDDYVLKCAYRMKSMHIIVDSQDENWDTVFVTNDQLLSLKAHAGSIPCINVKEAKEILKNKDCSPSTTLCQANVAVSTRNTKSQVCPDKSKTDANRLRECAYIFCRNQTEENLSLLARMTCWLYSYYSSERTEKGNTNYKVLMENGLHKELCCSSCKSRKLMEELREFSINYKHEQA
uniref:Protein LZIC n=1 Tax=Angiostrongylus cantonensis TaxID=6313 RepID=A0A158P619_ANGCA